MALNETELQRAELSGKIIEAFTLALDVAVLFYDRHDKLIAASPEFRRFFDVPEELLQPGARLRDLLGASYDAGAGKVKSIDGKVRHTNREDWIAERIAIHWRERFDSINKLTDGRWIKISKRRMPDGFLVSIIADVSEQKRRDAELSGTRQQAELAQYILDNLVNPVMVKDSSLRYVIVNDAFCRIPGLHAKQVIGRTATDLVEPSLASCFEEIERKVLETGVSHEKAEDIVCADGTVMHAITRTRRSGTPGNHYVTVSIDDITNVVDAKVHNPRTLSRYDIDLRQPGKARASTKRDRVLVVDADCERGACRAAELKLKGLDALAIDNSVEAIAFLEVAKSMEIAVSRIELCETMTEKLRDKVDPDRFPVLADAFENRGNAASGEPSSGGNSVVQDKPDEFTRDQPGHSMRHSDEPVTKAHAEAPMEKRSPAVEPGETVQITPPANQAPPATRPHIAPAPSAPTGVVGRPESRLRVLVAEDNVVNQIVFEQILEGIGVDFRIVADGEKAVAAWRAAPPNLILMDVSMPTMNGLQATQAIREAEAAEDHHNHTTIIAVTAHAMDGDRQRCLEAGMDDYLSKPVSPEKLEALIQKWTAQSVFMQSAR